MPQPPPQQQYWSDLTAPPWFNSFNQHLEQQLAADRRRAADRHARTMARFDETDRRMQHLQEAQDELTTQFNNLTFFDGPHGGGFHNFWGDNGGNNPPQ